MYTFQDFEAKQAKTGLSAAIEEAINSHISSEMYRMAQIADDYDHQRNRTILETVKWIYDDLGRKAVDVYSSCNRMCNNLFNRLNTQRMSYSLGNGVSFTADSTKEKLGEFFDTTLRNAGYYSLIHGEAFLFFNNGFVSVFKLTEFVPLLDEMTGAMRAGVRFWQIDSSKPMFAVLYEEDGYTRFIKGEGGFVPQTEKAAYIITERTTAADAAAGIAPEISTENYDGRLPIVPLWGSRLHQSTIVGMREKLDGIDLVQSGFADDLQDCASIYWLVSGAGAATDEDMQKFRDKVKLQHIASVPNSGDVQIQPYTQEIPYQARKELLDNLRASVYEDFGGLDVHSISAASTNDHIDAAYDPLDRNADDFEYQIIQAVQELLALAGVTGDDSVPIFKRDRISNQFQTTQMVLMAAQYLDDDTTRAHLPWLTVDEVEALNEKAAADDMKRIRYDDEPEDGEE